MNEHTENRDPADLVRRLQKKTSEYSEEVTKVVEKSTPKKKGDEEAGTAKTTERKSIVGGDENRITISAGPSPRGGSASPQQPILPSASSPFLSQSPSPDARHQEECSDKSSKRQKGEDLDVFDGEWWGSLFSLGAKKKKDEFHTACLMELRRANLKDVQVMDIIQSKGTDYEGRKVVLVVGAHYRYEHMSAEEKHAVLLLALREIQKIVSLQEYYSIVYFHTAVTLPAAPDISKIKLLHSALGPDHRKFLHTLYVVHPSFALKCQIGLLKMVDSIYKKVKYIESMSKLFEYIPMSEIGDSIPEVTLDQENMMAAAAAGDGMISSRHNSSAVDIDEDEDELYREVDIEKLTVMGFSRLEAIGALIRSKGDVNEASVNLIKHLS